MGGMGKSRNKKCHHPSVIRQGTDKARTEKAQNYTNPSADGRTGG